MSLEYEWKDMNWGEFLDALNDLSLARHLPLDGSVTVRIGTNPNRVSVQTCGEIGELNERIEELEGAIDVSVIKLSNVM